MCRERSLNKWKDIGRVKLKRHMLGCDHRNWWTTCILALLNKTKLILIYRIHSQNFISIHIFNGFLLWCFDLQTYHCPLLKSINHSVNLKCYLVHLNQSIKILGKYFFIMSSNTINNILKMVVDQCLNLKHSKICRWNKWSIHTFS